MASQTLHITAYDIADPKRQHQARQSVKSYASGGQKSVYECYLSTHQRRQLLSSISQVIDQQLDRFYCFQVTKIDKIVTIGIATPPINLDLFYIG